MKTVNSYTGNEIIFDEGFEAGTMIVLVGSPYSDNPSCPPLGSVFFCRGRSGDKINMWVDADGYRTTFIDSETFVKVVSC
jgi:hypothetical protein